MALSDIFGEDGAAMPLGLALMRMGGRSDRPRNLGVELGAAMEQQAKMKQAKQQQLMQQLQMDQIKRAILKEKKMEGLSEQLANLPQQFMKAAVPGTPETTRFEQPIMTQGMGGEVPQIPELLGRGQQIPPEMLGQATPEMLGTAPTPMASLLQNIPQPAPQPAPNLATQTVPGTPGQPASMDYEGLMQAQLPLLEQMKPGTSFEYAANRQKAKEDREFKAAELKQKYNDRIEEIKLRAEEGRISEKEKREQMLEASKQLAQLAAGLGDGRGKTPVYYIDDRQGSPTFGQAIVGDLQDARGKRGANYTPELKGALAEATASGKETGEASTKAKMNLPQATQQAELAIQHIDEMVGSEDGKTKPHEGFQDYVGATWKPFSSKVEGTPAASFKAREEQLKGGAFLDAYETLKGGGQITEIEGKKATAARNRMDKAQSEDEYKAAAREYQKVLKQAVMNARKKASFSGSPSNNDDPLGLR